MYDILKTILGFLNNIFQNDLPAVRKIYKKRYGVEMADHMRHQFGLGLGEAVCELANKVPQSNKGKVSNATSLS